jgi:hypothetical protein
MVRVSSSYDEGQRRNCPTFLLLQEEDVMQSQRELVLEAIQNGKTATSKAVKLKESSDPDVRELANAVHHLAFALQQIGLALTDTGRNKDLSV